MIRYAVGRIGMLVGILFGVLTLTFVIERVLPGSPVEMMLGPKPTQEQIELARKALGLDRSMPEQFLIYLNDILHGDLGTSLLTSRPVTEELATRLPATFELVFLAMALSILIGLPLGVLSAVKQDSVIDHAARSSAIAGVALPIFFTGMILQMVFYGSLGILPLQGRIGSEILLDHPFRHVTGFYLIDTLLAGNTTAFKSALAHLVLPTATITIASLATVTRIARGTMIEALAEDHIRTLQAYGVAPRRIQYRYALKTALVPMLTVIGLTFGLLLGGSVVVEYIFDWPGLGGFAVKAIINNDFPAVIGVTMFLASSYLLVNLAVDLLYFAVDPRMSRS